MTAALERWTSDDPHDARLALGATGLLRTFNEAGVLTAADVHVARRTAEIVGEDDESVRLAVALAVRAVRQGSVCVDLAGSDDAALPWPDTAGWLDRVAASPLAEAAVVRADGSLAPGRGLAPFPAQSRQTPRASTWVASTRPIPESVAGGTRASKSSL